MNRRREAGFFQLPAALVVTAVVLTVWVSAALIPAAMNDLHDASQVWWRDKQEVARGLTPFPVVTVDGPRGSKNVSDCIKDRAAKFGLTWTATGWLADSVPKPSLTAEGAKDQQLVTTWQRETIEYVKSVSDAWSDCRDKDSSDPGKSTPSSSFVAAIVWKGTYTVGSDLRGSADCSEPPISIVASGTNESASFVISYRNFSDTITGTVGDAGDFNANGVRNIGGGLGLRLLGTFAQEGSPTTPPVANVLQRGQLVMSSDTTCTYTFTAKK